MEIKDVIVIGGGQSALACGYYLERARMDYIILDNQETCGGAWLKTWDSLTLFSPSQQSSLPGWLMPASREDFPSRKEVIDYLCRYEERYKMNINRPVNVTSVIRKGEVFKVRTSQGNYFSKTVISATGTWSEPFIPEIPGREKFEGDQVHSGTYKDPEPFQDKKVLIVGEGNSGAQILAEVSRVARTSWATRKKPQFLPDDVDGRVLFNQASAKYYAEKKGEPFEPGKYDLGNIVMLPTVREARSRNVLRSRGSFHRIYEKGVIWDNGRKEEFDSILWCTGFRAATGHLKGLASVSHSGKIKTSGTRALESTGLWLVGYGGWNGFASATLIGVGRSAKKTVEEIQEFLRTAKK